MRGARTADAITPRVVALIREVEVVTGAPVTMIDTGPGLSDVIDLVPAGVGG